jgi:hypothetical protein
MTFGPRSFLLPVRIGSGDTIRRTEKMPLYENAERLIRANLERCRCGARPPAVVIGTLTEIQLAAINEKRVEDDLPVIIADVVFVGLHAYQSRAGKDGYQIDDMLDQIQSAMSAESIVIDTPYMTAMENPNARADRYGNQVNDRAVFECTKKFPRPELFSVAPRGDTIKPPK